MTYNVFGGMLKLTQPTIDMTVRHLCIHLQHTTLVYVIILIVIKLLLVLMILKV